MNEKNIRIPLSKGKLALAFLGCVLFVGTSLFLLTIADDFSNSSWRRNPMVVRIVSYISIVFFGLLAFLFIFKLIDSKHGLLIDEKGITDNSNLISVGFISWDTIIKIESKQMFSNKFILIFVDNPNQYILEENNILKRKLRQSNLKTYGTPIAISSNSLQTNFKDLEQNMHIAFDAYK